MDEILEELVLRRKELQVVGNNFNKSVQKLNSVTSMPEAEVWQLVVDILTDKLEPSIREIKDSSKWLESIGTGAMKRTGDPVEVEGAIFALQKQLNLSIHVGGKSALAMLGRSHYLELDEKEVTLFGQENEKLPKWFSDYEWASKLKYYRSGFIAGKVGLTDFDSKNFSIKISGPVRALFECLYLAPKEQSLLECYELMEGMNNLRPPTVQEILELCNSVKVKRLFLFMAEKAGHSWLKHVKCEKIDLGTGKRSIVPNGVYVSKYEITIPKELADYGSGV